MPVSVFTVNKELSSPKHANCTACLVCRYFCLGWLPDDCGRSFRRKTTDTCTAFLAAFLVLRRASCPEPSLLRAVPHRVPELWSLCLATSFMRTCMFSMSNELTCEPGPLHAYTLQYYSLYLLCSHRRPGEYIYLKSHVCVYADRLYERERGGGTPRSENQSLRVADRSRVADRGWPIESVSPSVSSCQA